MNALQNLAREFRLSRQTTSFDDEIASRYAEWHKQTFHNKTTNFQMKFWSATQRLGQTIVGIFRQHLYSKNLRVPWTARNKIVR